MCILAAITDALLCWPLLAVLAVLALRRNDRLASHPVLFAKTSHLFFDEYLVRITLELILRRHKRQISLNAVPQKMSPNKPIYLTQPHLPLLEALQLVFSMIARVKPEPLELHKTAKAQLPMQYIHALE